ncbi:glutamate--tRNA ligase [Candidatus Falkowbacteria bacterium]|nr:glutamate--tRNA ligase [Candidatus Falkowbacteria bacterium]
MLQKHHPVRVRFAPSPTGFVHVGSLLTVLFNWLLARQHDGTFILRIEDTDQHRLVPGAVENILKVLAWVGLNPDEGVVLDSQGQINQIGADGPYIQSQRLDLYRQYVDQLLESGHAYHCFCSPERLEKLRQNQTERKLPPMYDKYCLSLSPEAVAEKLTNLRAGDHHVIRLKVPPDGSTVFEDLIRGRVETPHHSVDDCVLLKSDGFPTYHLAVVVDDHLMAITHVIRGQEWLASAPKHVLLYQAFGWTPPLFAHLSHLLNTDRSKLSKRQGDVAVEEYMTRGYLPEALLNFLAITAWNEGEGSEQEIYSLKELVKKFSLERVHKTGAVFDLDKLNWLNGMYLRQMDIAELTKRVTPYLTRAGYDTTDTVYLKKIVALEQERIKTLAELPAMVDYFFTDTLEYQTELLMWKKSDRRQTKNNLEQLVLYLSAMASWDEKKLEEGIMTWIAEQQLTNGEVLWPMRVALSGQDKSPGPFAIAAVIGKTRTLERLRHAAAKL